MISVIIPVFNGLNFLRDAVDSVLHQSYHDFELVIVDDASDEDIESCVRTHYSAFLDQKKIRFFRNDKNMERCYSRNRGVDLSSGEIVIFLDHDDRFKKHHFSEINKAFVQFPDVDLVYSIPEEIIDSQNQIVGKRQKSKLDPDLVKLALQAFFCTVGLSFRKSSFNQIGQFNLITTQREDYELTCRAIIQHRLKVKIISSNSVQIRQKDKPVSRIIRRPSDPFLYFSKVLVGLVENYEMMKVRKVAQRYLPYLYLEVINLAISYNDIRYAVHLLVKTFVLNPSFVASYFRVVIRVFVRFFYLSVGTTLRAIRRICGKTDS